ncbi:MAG TPA: alpha/beta fold hydrolase [Thermoanaerobaculia bacterium]|nr:alpha/beta fold hydrolase [Thermoanaerobaculia bacterium]
MLTLVGVDKEAIPAAGRTPLIPGPTGLSQPPHADFANDFNGELKSGNGKPTAADSSDRAPRNGAEAAGNGSGPAPSLGSMLDFVAGSWGPKSFADVCACVPPEQFVHVGEQRVHFEQAGHGEAVVLLHGFGGSCHAWRLVMPALARRFRVIAIDLNGFGWTQRPKDVAAYTYAGQAEMVLGALRALGIERFHVAGHSYGGGLALWLAGRHPARVRSVVLVSSVLPDYSQQLRQAWARFRTLNWLLVHFFVLSRAGVRRTLEVCFHDKRRITSELVDAYRERLLVEGVDDAYYGLMAPVDLPVPEVALGEVQAPTLVVWGREDRVIPLQRAEAYVPQLPDAKLVVIDSCGHVALEECPQQLVAEMLPFLERHRERWPLRLRGALGRFSRRAAAV